ncbi:polyprenyl synthetase family protein [Streptomyces sp. NPDC001941]|uniref:polyprenyl synthetase family protein n=1 Tax=Streptomyces sp. NPDC001941 TaxID=3154659 RepID=UPI003332DCF8
MTTAHLTPATVDLDDIRRHVDATLDSYLDRLDHSSAHGELRPLTKVLRDFLHAGGKRLRPLLCVVGWHAAGGVGSRRAVLHLAAALELLHASVLIHDDIIDDAASRRGHPTAHLALASQRLGAEPEAAARFGASAALLLGDLALVWADQLLRAVPLTAREAGAVVPVWDAVRGDVLTGQYLDLLATGSPRADVDSALAISRYKTAHYTVERPLQAGAALAGATPGLLSACSAFALPLGEAFQLRDDLLGVFGDPRDTGKSADGDLREGKHTPLIALTLQRARPNQLAALHAHLGNPALSGRDAAAVREIVVATGARDTVEEMITDRYREALSALDAAGFTAEGAHALRALADSAVWRSS